MNNITSNNAHSNDNFFFQSQEEELNYVVSQRTIGTKKDARLHESILQIQGMGFSYQSVHVHT